LNIPVAARSGRGTLGLIHRDLKPANIVATRRGGRYDFVKLLDFGLVQEVVGLAPAGRGREPAACETPAFMASEQVLNDRPLDPRCDLYAIGADAYNLLTGTIHPPARTRGRYPGSIRRLTLSSTSSYNTSNRLARDGRASETVKVAASCTHRCVTRPFSFRIREPVRERTATGEGD